MSTMDLQTILETDASLSAREIGEETLIVSERGDTLHILNNLGQAIWRAMDGQHTLAQIVEQICTEYSVSQAVAEADLRRFAAELVQMGLVHVRVQQL